MRKARNGILPLSSLLPKMQTGPTFLSVASSSSSLALLPWPMRPLSPSNERGVDRLPRLAGGLIWGTAGECDSRDTRTSKEYALSHADLDLWLFVFSPSLYLVFLLSGQSSLLRLASPFPTSSTPCTSKAPCDAIYRTRDSFACTLSLIVKDIIKAGLKKVILPNKPVQNSFTLIRSTCNLHLFSGASSACLPALIVWLVSAR